MPGKGDLKLDKDFTALLLSILPFGSSITDGKCPAMDLTGLTTHIHLRRYSIAMSHFRCKYEAVLSVFILTIVVEQTSHFFWVLISSWTLHPLGCTLHYCEQRDL